MSMEENKAYVMAQCPGAKYSHSHKGHEIIFSIGGKNIINEACIIRSDYEHDIWGKAVDKIKKSKIYNRAFN